MGHGILFGIFQIYEVENPTSAVPGSQKAVTNSGKLRCWKFPKPAIIVHFATARVSG